MDEPESDELIRHLFAVVTGLLEDAGGLSAEGQNRQTATLSHVDRVEALTSKTLVILRAMRAIADMA